MSSICAASMHAAGVSISPTAGRVTLANPKVVIAVADASTFPSPFLSSRFPDHAVVPRDEARRRNVRIAWDPYPGVAQGAEVRAPQMPIECRSDVPLPAPTTVTQATVGSKLIAQPIAQGLSTTIGFVVLGGVGLVALGLIGYFGVRYLAR